MGEKGSRGGSLGGLVVTSGQARSLARDRKLKVEAFSSVSVSGGRVFIRGKDGGQIVFDQKSFSSIRGVIRGDRGLSGPGGRSRENPFGKGRRGNAVFVGVDRRVGAKENVMISVSGKNKTTLRRAFLQAKLITPKDAGGGVTRARNRARNRPT